MQFVGSNFAMKNKPFEFRIGHSHTVCKFISPETPVRYAEASGARNPLHLDAEAATQSGLGGAVLHGMCSMAFMLSGLMLLCGESVFIRDVDLRFSFPVIPGEVVVFKYVVARTEPGRLEFAVSARNSAGREVLKNVRVGAVIRNSSQEHTI